MKGFRALVNLAVAAVMASSLVLTGGLRAAAAPSHAGVTLTVASWSTATVEADAVKKLLAAFTSKYHIATKYQVINGDYETVLKSRITAGTAPDVFYVDTSYAQDFAQTGQFYNLDFLKSDKSYNFNALYKPLLKPFEAKGHVYGIAKDYSTLATWYNKNMFKAAHISGPPTTWAQAKTDACKLTNKSKKVYGTVIPADPARWLAFLKAAGGSLFNKNMTKVTVDSPQAKQALDFWAGLVKSGCAAIPSTVGATWAGQAFGEGLAAFVFEGNWLTQVMQQTYPNIKWGTALLPKGPKGYGNLAFGAAWSIWAKTKNASAAKQFITFATGKDGEALWSKYSAYLPSRKDDPLPAGGAVYAKQVKYAVGYYFPPHFASALTPIGNDLQKAMQGQLSTSDALKDMQQQGTTALSAP